MRIKEFNIILDIKKLSGSEPFEVVQGDTQSNIVNIFLVDGLEPYDLTGTTTEIIFSKSDGTTVQQTDAIIINELDGKLQCTLKTNTIASPGKVIAEVRILSGEILLTSARFDFYVRKSLLNDETIESTNEFPTLTQLIVEINGLIGQVNQIVQQVPETVVERIDNLEFDKINKIDMVHTDTISDPTKVPSSVVTEALGKDIDAINNNLANNIAIGIDARGLNILDKVAATPSGDGMSFLNTSSASSGYPDTTATWLYSMGQVIKKGSDKQIILYGYQGVAIALNYYNGTTKVWEGWAKTTLT